MSGAVQNISLRRTDNSHSWGFRMRGGAEQGMPLYVENVAANSISAAAGLTAGDVIVQICNSNVQQGTHGQAKQEVLRAGNELDLLVQKGGMAGGSAPTAQAQAQAQAQTQSQVVEEHIPSLGGPVYKDVQPKTYQILEQELAQGGQQQPAPSVLGSRGAAGGPVRSQGPASIFNRNKQERSGYLQAKGPTIQKAFGQRN